MPRSLVVVATALLAAPAAAQTPGDDFFEKKIRPVLVEHCYSCHSADAAAKNKLKGGLALDTRDATRAGGDSGPALVAGDPAKSLVVESLRYTGDLRMPPKGKLPAAVVADFEQWVKMGAPDPRTAAAGVKKQVGLSIDEGKKFWSYKPVANPAAPAVKNAAWPAADIDRYVLAALEAKGLSPAADADRATLARRLYFDLHGLPPTPEETDAFVNDRDPQAYEKLVDRLLASPRFGERWGRHWLDTARYAESVTLRGLVFKEAWRYRDYVIDAFNRDVPLDQFVREQLAGDLLAAATPEERARLIIATTYLQLGNTNLEEQDKRQLRMDVVDEQLDVIGKGLLGQTISCARCHDHKFDPIPTADYYALAGILRNVKALKDSNVSNWVEVPLPAAPEVEAAVAKHESAVSDLQARIKVAKAKAPKDAAAERTVKGVLALKDVPGIVVDDAAAKKVGMWKDSTFSGTYIGAGYTHDDAKGQGEKTITFDPDIPVTGRYEIWFAYSPGGSRAKDVPVTVFSADGEKTLHLDLTPNPPIRGRFVSLGQYRFEKDGQSFVLISNEGAKGHVTADAMAFIPVDQVPADKAKAPGAPVAAADQAAALEAELKKLQAAAPKRPMAMSVIEEAKIEDAKINVRGIVHNLGAVAPRGFLKVATVGQVPAMPKDQSGRVQLADWVASKDNPLTARVYANRAWHWLFGSGLVRTADNFGTTGEAPSNPELLDHLATRFVADGWSVKKLVRAIVLSRTYRQSSRADAKAITADPENRLFGRANRRRLEAEAIRDTMLTVGGKLAPFAGGPNFKDSVAADYGYKHTALTRSVYLPVFRNALPEAFEAFDFADPSAVVGKRGTSTVAPQALFMLNNPFPAEQARAAAARVLAENLPSDEARLDRAYRLALGRLPTDGERAAMRRYLANQSGSPAAAWAAVFQALFASADFRYVE
jgi:cytochrome c553